MTSRPRLFLYSGEHPYEASSMSPITRLILFSLQILVCNAQIFVPRRRSLASRIIAGVVVGVLGLIFILFLITAVRRRRRRGMPDYTGGWNRSAFSERNWGPRTRKSGDQAPAPYPQPQQSWGYGSPQQQQQQPYMGNQTPYQSYTAPNQAWNGTAAGPPPPYAQEQVYAAPPGPPPPAHMRV